MMQDMMHDRHNRDSIQELPSICLYVFKGQLFMKLKLNINNNKNQLPLTITHPPRPRGRGGGSWPQNKHRTSNRPQNKHITQYILYS